MNHYQEMKDRRQKEVDALPLKFAFDNSQLKESLIALEVPSNEIDEAFTNDTLSELAKKYDIVSFGGGGFAKREVFEQFIEALKRFDEELKDAFAEDKTGEGFIFEAFYYELCNHEYAYTEEDEDTLDALGLTREEVEANENLKHGLRMAKDKIIEQSWV